MRKKYKNVEVRYASCRFDIEIDEEEIKFAKECGIEIENEEELVKFHIENNFGEHQDLLEIEDFNYEKKER